MNHRLRILLISVACDGTDVGEAWSSFQWANRLVERHDVTIITTTTTGRATARSQLPSHARVIEWPAQLDQFGRFSSMLKPDYVPYYFRARKWIKNALRAGETFDIAHQLSPLAMRYPSPAAGLGMPLILGPIGGSLDTPKEFAAEFGATPWYTRLRALDTWRLRHDPTLSSTYAGASLILGVAPYVRDLIGAQSCRRFEIMSETGVVTLPKHAQFSYGGLIRLLFVGRLTRSKGARDAIRALAQLPRNLAPWHFDILGEGEDRPACEAEARAFNIADKVTFHGRLPREQLDHFYARANLFLFPSFREPSGNAVLEAMSYGLPLIVADRGGPGYAVTPECGCLVPVTSPAQFASAIAAALAPLMSDPVLMNKMGAAARNRIHNHFLWERKIECMSHWYAQVANVPADGKVYEKVCP